MRYGCNVVVLVHVCVCVCFFFVTRTVEGYACSGHITPRLSALVVVYSSSSNGVVVFAHGGSFSVCVCTLCGSWWCARSAGAIYVSPLTRVPNF